MKKIKFSQLFPCILFVIYIGVVFWLTLYGSNRKDGISKANMTPFWEYAMVIKNQYRKSYIKQITGNIALFVPLGFLLPVLPHRHNATLRKVFICGFCFSAFIEITQYITGRGLMEFDDLFNNTVGALLGFGIYKLLTKDLQNLY